MGKSKNVREVFAVCTGSREGDSPLYAAAAEEVGDFLGRRRNVMAKFGGADYGLMGAFARAFKRAAAESGSGAELLGIMQKKYHRGETSEEMGCKIVLRGTHGGCISSFTADDTKAFIYLPGGTGTYCEFYSQIERDRNLASGMRPAFMLDIDGYYEGTFIQLDRGVRSRFTDASLLANVHRVTSVEGMKDKIAAVMGCGNLPDRLIASPV